MQECRIAAIDLACRRGDRILFSELSLALQPGEALRIAAPNGVGKSSLIRILAGLLRPQAGRVERAGTSGLLDEQAALDPHVTLGSAIGFWQRIDGADRGAHGTAMRRLDLADLADVPVGFLSTGQRKRAGLARLIGQQAAIWLLDEPLNGLDSQAAALTQALTREHCDAGGICVIASHQPFEMGGLQTLDLLAFVP